MPEHRVTTEEKQYYVLTEKVFNFLAPFYDLVAKPLSDVRHRVVNLAGASDGSSILDVATGTGEQAIAFAKNGHDVVGIDISEAMLAVANRKNTYANLRFEVGDATSLPFDDESFDVTCVSFALHDMPRGIRDRTLKEMFRVTKPTGLALIADYALPDTKVGRFFVYNIVRTYEGRYYSEFIRCDINGLLKASGFEVLRELRVLLGAGRIVKARREA